MRLTVVRCFHGKTPKNRSAFGATGAGSSSSNRRHPRTAPGHVGSASCRNERFPGANRACARSGSRHRPEAPSRFPGTPADAQERAQELGRTPPCLAERRARGAVSQALARPSQNGRRSGALAPSSRAGPKAGPAGQDLGHLSPGGTAWPAQSGPGHPSSQERSQSPGGLEKKLPEDLASVLKSEAVGGRPTRIVFQDEARFGRMVRIRRCWAPAPLRPKVDNGYERQFVYVYGAVSPLQGELDWKICPKMNTERMNEFLAQV